MPNGAHQPWTGYAKKHYRVTVITEEIETGKTTVFRFPDIEGFEVGMVPINEEIPESFNPFEVAHPWGKTEEYRIATTGLIKHDADGKSCVVQML